jgi:hypothetical protein
MMVVKKKIAHCLSIVSIFICLLSVSCSSVARHTHNVLTNVINSTSESSQRNRKIKYFEQNNYTNSQAREKVFIDNLRGQ